MQLFVFLFNHLLLRRQLGGVAAKLSVAAAELGAAVTERFSPPSPSDRSLVTLCSRARHGVSSGGKCSSSAVGPA